MLLSLLLLIPLIIMAVHLPIYSDELLYKWFSGRYWLDNGITLGLFPHCSDQFTQRTPKLFLVTRLIDSWLYAELNNPLKIRYLGIFSFLLWLTLMFFVCRRLFADQFSRQFGLCVALVFLGTLPLMMTLNRPEQSLILALTGLSLLPLAKNPTRLTRITLTLLFAFLTTWFFPQHPKTLLFLPFFSAVCFFLPLSSFARLSLGAWMIVMAYSSYSFYSKYHSCPANENIEQLFSATLISPSMFLKMPWFYTKQLIRNVFSIPRYFSAIIFSSTTEADWLPPAKTTIITTILNCFINLFLGGWCIGAILGCLKQVRKNKFSLTTDYRSSSSILLLAGICAMAVLQTTKSFYNSTLVFPAIILAGTLGNQDIGITFFPERIRRVLNYSTVALSFISFLFLGSLYLPTNLSEWKKGGRIERQYFSFSGFNWKSIENRIKQLESKCGLANTPSTKHLLVDDITYPFFIRTREPYHANYLTGYWAVGIENLGSFLRERKSDGLICQCKFLPPDLLSKVYREGDFCCLPAFK